MVTVLEGMRFVCCLSMLGAVHVEQLGEQHAYSAKGFLQHAI